MTMTILPKSNSTTHRFIRITCPRARQRGQAAVEIALTLPLLLLLLFGIVVSVFTFYAYIQVSNAAREGARAGSLYRTLDPTTRSDLDTEVRKAVISGSALGGLPQTATNPAVAVTSTGSKIDPRPGDKITAQVTYSYTQPLLSVFGPIFPQPLVIKRNVMMEMQ